MLEDAPDEPDGDLCDAVALVQALRAEDTQAVADTVRTMNAYGVAIQLAQLLAQAADEGRAAPGHFVDRAFQAASRS